MESKIYLNIMQLADSEGFTLEHELPSSAIQYSIMLAKYEDENTEENRKVFLNSYNNMVNLWKAYR